MRSTYSRFIETYEYRTKQYDRIKIPPKRYVGVGYRDQGSRRNVAYDGSPSWQEVATSAIMRDSQENQHNGVRAFLISNGSIYDDSKSWIRLIHRKLEKSWDSV